MPRREAAFFYAVGSLFALLSTGCDRAVDTPPKDEAGVGEERGPVVSGVRAGLVADRAAGAVSGGVRAKLSVSPAELIVPTDPGAPAACEFTLTLEMHNVGAKAVHLVPLSPFHVELYDARGKRVPLRDDHYLTRLLREDVFRSPVAADYPCLGPVGGKPIVLAASGILGADNSLLLSFKRHGIWVTEAPLSQGDYQFLVIYTNRKARQSTVDRPIIEFWTGTVTSDQVSVSVGAPLSGVVSGQRAREIALGVIGKRRPAWQERGLALRQVSQAKLLDGTAWHVGVIDPTPKPAVTSYVVKIDARTGKILEVQTELGR